MDKVYVVVVTFNAMPWIDRCISSLSNNDIAVNTIVIDNCSSDDTCTHISKNYPEVRVIQSEINLGFGRGNNIGLKLALKEKADYVLLLNQDAWVDNTCISTLIKAHKDNPHFGVLSPQHLSAERQSLETKFEEYCSPLNTPQLLSDFVTGNKKTVYKSNFVNAAVWLMSSDCLSVVGGFNPLFPHYGEDEEYIFRTKYHGFSLGIVPEAVAVHDARFSWEKIEFNPKRNLIFNLIPLSNINHPLRSAFLSFLKRSFDELTTLLVFRKFRKFRVRFLAFWKTIFMMKSIASSRKSASAKGAFI